MWKLAMQKYQNIYKASEKYEKPQAQNIIRSISEHEISLIQKRSVKLLYNKYGLLQLHKSQNTSLSLLYKIMKAGVLTL